MTRSSCTRDTVTGPVDGLVVVEGGLRSAGGGFEDLGDSERARACTNSSDVRLRRGKDTEGECLRPTSRRALTSEEERERCRRMAA